MPRKPTPISDTTWLTRIVYLPDADREGSPEARLTALLKQTLRKGVLELPESELPDGMTVKRFRALVARIAESLDAKSHVVTETAVAKRVVRAWLEPLDARDLPDPAPDTDPVGASPTALGANITTDARELTDADVESMMGPKDEIV